MRNLLKVLSTSLVLSFAVMTCVPVNAAEYAADFNTQSDIQAAQPDLSIQPEKKKLETPAEKPDLADKPDLKEIKLTKKQQKELAGLSKDILENQKKLVSKYVKYGILSEEKGNKILSHMDQRYIELEKNGFIPNWKKHHKHDHK